MSKTRDTGFLANVIQVHDTGVRIMSGSEMLMAISSSGAVTITGELSGSDAANSLLLDGTGSLAFTTTASYNAFSASYGIASASLSSRTTQVERTYATTGSNTFTGAQYISDTSNAIGFTSTASLYSDGGLRVQGNSFVSGTAYFNNIVVYGTSSIQYITSSQVNIGSNIITVNTDTPAVRFGGLSVFDSGSTQLTGSIFWDSEKNHWVYSNPSGSSYSGGMLISGPRSSALGSEQGTTSCMLLVGQGGDHLTSSMIYHSSTCTNFYSNALFVSSSGNVGIGTNAPTSGLEVITNGASLNAIRSTTSQAFNTGPETSVVFRYKHNNAGDYTSGAIINTAKDNNTDGNQSGNLQFWTNCAGTIAEKMRITSCGNVGIGITTPFQTAKLQVNVGANMNWAVQPGTFDCTGIKLNTFVDSGASNVPLELNANILYLKTCENVRMTITGTGNVGINTTNFGEKFNIGCGAAIGFQNTCNCQKWHIQYNSNDGLNFVESAVADFRLFLKAGGNIGMGTATPEYPLHIYRCANLGLKIQTCGSSFGSPSINLLNGGVDTVLSATNTGLEIGTWSANDIIFRVTQVERMRINTSGIVTMPFQPSMLAQPGASMFPIGNSQTAYGWCTSGSIRYNCGFTLTSATSAACNIADAQNTGKIIIPATGKYALQFSQRNEGQCTGDGQFFLWVNGTQRIRRHIELWNFKPYIHVDVTAILSLNINDCLEMGAWFNPAGKTDTFSGTGDQVNWLSLAKIS